MDGLFSPIATWMLRWDGLAVGAAFTACPQGDPSGACSFGDFSCTSKKSYSPVVNVIRNEVVTSRRAKKSTNLSSAVVLFRPSQGKYFAQSVIDSGE